MTHKARFKIAAAIVVLFLAALSAAGLVSHTPAPGAGVTGQVPGGVHATAAPAQTYPQTFEHDSND